MGIFDIGSWVSLFCAAADSVPLARTVVGKSGHAPGFAGLEWCSTTLATITSYSVNTSALPRSLAYLCSG